MNQFFSFKRFSLLVQKHWADNKKRYSLSVVAIIGLLIIWFVFSILTRFDNVAMGREIQTITYFFGLFGVGCFYASQYFNDLSSRPKGINFLLVPASAFEKLLCSLLYTVVLFFVVFTTAYYLVDLLVVSIAKMLPAYNEQAGTPTVVNVFAIINPQFNNDTSLNFLCFFFSVQAAFLLGSVYFEKFSFIKTVISGFVAGFILFCLVYFFNELMPPGDYPKGFLTAYRVRVDGVNDRLVEIPAWIGQVLRFLVLNAVAPFLWVVTYFRLKEKQV